MACYVIPIYNWLWYLVSIIAYIRLVAKRDPLVLVNHTLQVVVS